MRSGTRERARHALGEQPPLPGLCALSSCHRSVDQEQKHADSKHCEPEYFNLYSGRHKAGWVLARIQKSQQRVQK
jgi:hypothetical protein